MKRVLFLLFVTLVSSASAFAPPSRQTSSIRQQTSTTELAEGRRWNFNEGKAPWGLKRNAEIWNGRVAQVAFTLTFLQELIQGKGVFVGLAEKDPVNIACLGIFAVGTLGLTAFLALQGDDEYREEV